MRVVAKHFVPAAGKEHHVANTAYGRQRDLLVHDLSAMRLRLRAAKDRAASSSSDDALPRAVLDAEAEVAARGAASDSQLLPLERLRLCFDLSATEMLVLRMLVSHELCQTSRSIIRDLNSEHLA